MSRLGKLSWIVPAPICTFGAVVILASTLARPAAATQPSTALSPWLAADLDGDQRPDLARAGAFRRHGAGFEQEIQLGFSAAEPDTLLVLTPVVGYRLIARDVDGDSDSDLVLETLSREPVAVLVNDGGGRFHQADLDPYRHLFPRQERSSVDAPASRDALALTGWAPPGAAVLPHPTAAAGAVSWVLPAFSAPAEVVAELTGAYTRGPPLR